MHECHLYLLVVFFMNLFIYYYRFYEFNYVDVNKICISIFLHFSISIANSESIDKPYHCMHYERRVIHSKQREENVCAVVSLSVLHRSVFLRMVSLGVLLFTLWSQITCEQGIPPEDCTLCHYNYKSYPVCM